MKFDSQEFNNISTPIISFFGFVAVVITIALTIKQIKSQQGNNFLIYYRETFQKIAAETIENKQSIGFSTYELLNFVIYYRSAFLDLKKFPQFVSDLNDFKRGINSSSSGKTYDNILGNARFFMASLDILLKRYKSLLGEIMQHTILDATQKELLIKDLFDSQGYKYYYGITVLESDSELKEMVSDFYIDFGIYEREKLKVFNNQFFQLRNIIQNNEQLKRIMES
ncbi:MAG: hypothetical protein Q8891_07650 [Bacteroidota bacterium]|nr:hypothetical protein [Bacteroidota bacterium]